MTATLPRTSPQPMMDRDKSGVEQLALYLVVLIPFLALIAAVPVAWGWGLGWVDVILFVVLYAGTGHGITIGFHRYFTHGAFKAGPRTRTALAVIGSMAIQGSIIQWVADHRRHHAYSDRDGDPHSPWRFGTSLPALFKGLFHAHMGWLFQRAQTNRKRYAPDLLAIPSLTRVDRFFGLWAGVSLVLPFVLGGLLTWSWSGALSALFWAGLVRVCVLHHVTWSINSICHTIGERPFASRDKSANFWPLAILSLRRVLAQQPPRRPDGGPARRPARTAGLLGPADPLGRTARSGLGRALALGRADRLQAGSGGRPDLT